jgi:hypothetical protein
MGKSNVVTLEETMPQPKLSKKEVLQHAKDMTDLAKEDKQKTDKKYLKRAEKLVRKLDNVLTDLNKVTVDARTLEAEIITSEVSRRDEARFSEMAIILESSTNVLFQLTDRMARKYVGKEIDNLGRGRSSLKQ